MKTVSPRSAPVAIALSFATHALIYAGVVAATGWKGQSSAPAEDYIDLGYEVYEEPPPPAPAPSHASKVREVIAPAQTPPPKADSAPRELQNEKGEVAGTQEAKKPEAPGDRVTGDVAAAPYYKVKPKYPKAALISGVEGWVLLQVDVDESGAVANVRVVDGEQREMFGGEARRAVSQWKYRPFTDSGGHPVRKIDHQVRVDFKLEDMESSGS